MRIALPVVLVLTQGVRAGKEVGMDSRGNGGNRVPLRRIALPVALILVKKLRWTVKIKMRESETHQGECPFQWSLF